MLPINDLGSDSPLYFSLLEHPCAHDLTRITGPVVTVTLWFRAQSRCPRTNRRPCASVETVTCTNPSTECCSAKCSPLASASPRAWIQVRQSARQFQLHPDRQLANRAAHRRARLRGKLNALPRELAASLLFVCVVVESPHTVHIAPSLADNYSSLSGFSDAEGGGRRALLICHCLACLFLDRRASQINSSQINSRRST